MGKARGKCIKFSTPRACRQDLPDYTQKRRKANNFPENKAGKARKKFGGCLEKALQVCNDAYNKAHKRKHGEGSHQSTSDPAKENGV
jgi:hypothetical protein